MNVQEQITYGDMCQVVADAWNNSKCETKLTGHDIFNLHPTGELYWLPYLYEVAEQGTEMLEGLLLTDSFYAKMFCNKIEN